jgi:transcription initiation factor TFIID subunit 2
MAYYITDMFIRKLFGNNEYRFQQKKAADKVCEIDVFRPSIYETGRLVSLDPSQLELIAIKAPLVLYILDRRLTKASGSNGLSRIISRLLLQAKTGEMMDAALSTIVFMKTCERFAHFKLDIFFNQWVFGAGCPRFNVTQRFNKKRLVVEMLIQQRQGEVAAESELESGTFIRDVKEEYSGIYAAGLQLVFTVRMSHDPCRQS